MTDTAPSETPAAESPSDMKLVVSASAAGTAFEWYDFFVYAPLAPIIQKVFFSELNEATGFIFALGVFAAGFAFRPIGALLFGRLGDREGRKGAFLITISLMGLATFLIGCLPTYGQVGVLAPALLLLMRILQGLALGGEWGGAAIYIAEHAPDNRRGFLTSFIGSSAAFGLAGALLVTLGARWIVNDPVAFEQWGWRIPFWASAFLLAISLWIRVKLHESPTFARMKAEGNRSEKPYVESFGRWPNLKLVLIALFGIMIAQGAVWYTAFFYAQTFLEKFAKVSPATVNTVMIGATLASAPLYIFFGWLSDRWGRKTVMVGGMILAAIGFFPVFHAMSAAGNPALAEASARAPVTVVADPAECSLQFDPVGKSQFRTSCDIAKSTLTNAGVDYRNVAAPAGSVAVVRVGDQTVASVRGDGLAGPELAAAKAGVDGRIRAALTAAGYPPTADPAQVNAWGIFWPLMLLVVGACALYGPQAAALVELFPTRVRYTALSLPYHIGTGWVGGFLPATAFAMVASSGDLYFGLWYPLLFTVLAILVALIFLPETRGRDLEAI